MHTTIKSVMHIVNLVLSKSVHLQRFTEAAAAALHSLLAAYVPAVLVYLPEQKVGKEFIFLLLLLFLMCALFYLGAAHTMVNVVGMLYPGYVTISTIENPQRPEHEVCDVTLNCS